MKVGFKRLLAFLCGILFVMQISVFSVLADEPGEGTIQTLSPASTQQRRMWCNQSYNSTDWVYEPWTVANWGRINYVRFASDNVAASMIKKATIKLDARAREKEKTVYLAALALSDDSALKVESNLASLTSTNKVKSTAKADKLLTDKKGYYLPAVSSSVVAYTKATASDTATEENIYTNSAGTLVFNYPLEIELDVTDTVRSAFSKSNHVQFALLAAKDILTADGENLYDMSDFGSYAGGVIYDENGNVLKNTEDALNLDTSIPVCGNAGYYTSSDINDEYFSWLYMVRDSIALEIEYQNEEDAYSEFAEGIDSKADFANSIDNIAYLLNENSWMLYNKIRSNSNVNEVLFEALKESSALSDFQNAFINIVDNVYWQGYQLRINIKSELGGKRGVIAVEGKNDVPDSAYALIEVYDSESALVKSYTVNVKDGLGYYNIYDRDDQNTRLDITLTSDKWGTQAISGTQTVYLENITLPSVFITEISNQHTNTYYPDKGTQNSGTREQPFQYIELYNYNDKAVDLKECAFVYNDGKEHVFELITESGGNLILNPGELYVIGVYSADSAALGYTYDTDAAISAYWDGFNAFYGTDVPVSNRAMIACVASGNGDAMLDGINHLERSNEAGTTVTAELRKDGQTVTKVSMPDNNPGSSYAYQFIPSDGETKDESFLFCTGCFPYKLLDEQNLDYCEKVFFSNADEIKVMSYNILATNNSGKTVAQRFPLFIRTVENYDLDIIGMQEVNYLWIDYLESQMLSNYSCVQGYSTYGRNYSSASGTWDLMNPIYYRNDRYTLLDSGAAFLTPDGKKNTAQWDSVNMKRTMTWAVLQNNETSEIVSFINTHLVLSGKQARVEQVKLVYEKGAELQAKYGGGIVIVGDHNMHEVSEPYQAYYKGGVVVDSKYQTTKHTSVGTYTGFSTYNETYGSPIDFCFISPGEYVVQKYEVFDGAYSDGTVSDHSAVYVELLDRKHVNNYESQIISYDSEKQSALVEFDGAKTYAVVFADYEDQKLVNIDVVEYTSDNACYAIVNQEDVSFTLNTGDKVFLLENTTSIQPLCEPYVIE